MENIDIAIIGGGIVGLAVAAEIAVENKDIFIFEKNDSFGQETSSRNSEVIHSGIYYPVDSIKTRTCVDGNRMLYDICRDNGIPHERTGKLIVAVSSGEVEPLEDLFRQGVENGLRGLQMLTSKEVRELEPNIEAVQAIFLPMTGIVDSHALMKYFLAKAVRSGADIIYGSEVKHIDIENGSYKITTINNMGQSYRFTAKIVINCAGLDSDIVARMVGIDKDDYRLHYCKGDYFRLRNKKNNFVKRLVYPVARQDDPGLGVHVTPDLAGRVRLGPDSEYLKSREINYAVDPAKRTFFYDSARNFLKFIEKDDLSADTSGVRPKLQGPNEPFRDFLIKHETDLGFTGFIDLIGIESPGLTASPAIARMVKKIIAGVV